MPLKVSHGIGAWIKDFKTSTNPRFKGKSDKERRDQAIAAYLSAKRDQKEEVDKTPPFEGPYKKKQSVVPGKHGEGPSTAKHLAKQGMKQAEKKPVKEVSTNTLTSYLRKASPTVDAAKERLPGIKKALHKLDQKVKKEETVNELDKTTLQSYKDKTKAQIGTLKKVAKTMDDPAHKAPWERGIGVRSKGLERAKKRLGEDVNESEQLDELSPGLLGRYTRARGSLNITKKQSKMKARAHQKMRDKTKDLSAIAGKYSNPADLTKTEKKYNEETELGEQWPKYKVGDFVKHDGKIHRVFGVNGTTLNTGTYYGKDKYGGTNRLHVSKVTKAPTPKGEQFSEETTFEVDIEGLPKMYIKDKSPGAVKAKLRGIVKQPSMIQGVDRVTDAEMKKTYRDKAQGRDDVDESVNEISGELAQRYHDKAVKAPAPKDKKDPLKHTIKRFASMQKAQDIIHKSELKRIGGQK